MVKSQPLQLISGRLNSDTHPAAISNIQGDLGCIVLGYREQGGHVFNRIVCLEVSRLHSNHAVIGSMRFIEAVAGELFPFIKDSRGGLFRDTPLHSPVNKLLAVLEEFLF